MCDINPGNVYHDRALGVTLGALVLCSVLIALAPAEASPGSSSDSWIEWRGSADHLGVSEGTIPDEGELRWRYRTGDQVQSSAVFHQGTMLMGSDDGKLYCFEPDTGEVLWKFATGGAVQATVLVKDGKAYFGSSDGFFYCLELPDPGDDQEKPRELWSYECGAPIVSSAHAAGDSLLFGCQDGFLYKLSLGGDFIWKTEIGWDVWASPLMDEENNRAYIGATNGNFACVEPEDGNVSWSFDAGEVYSSGCLWNGTIYLTGGIDQRLYAIDTGNGSELWNFATGHDTYSTPSYHEGRVYFGSFEYAWCLPAVDPDGDGNISETEVIWSTPTHDEQGGSSPLLVGGRMYIGSDDGNLYCLDMETGAIVWNYTTGGYVYSSPSLYNDSIYFGSCDGYVYCIGNRPPRLAVDIEAEVNEITSDDTLQLNITVRDQNGTVVEGARGSVVLSAGDFEVMGGGDGVLTDSEGRLEILFKPPTVSSRSTMEITVTAAKEGKEPGSASIFIVVEPGGGSGDDDTDTDSVVDRNVERMPYYGLLVVVVGFDVALGVGIVRMRRGDGIKKKGDN